MMKSPSVTKILYRSLLKTQRLFTREKNGAILCSLLYRSGINDHQLTTFGDASDNLRGDLSQEEARNLTRTYHELGEMEHGEEGGEEEWISNDQFRIGTSLDISQGEQLYLRLLQHVVGDEAYMNFPRNVSLCDQDVKGRLKNIISEEFRSSQKQTGMSCGFSEKARQEAAFLSLRELQKKVDWAKSLGLDLSDTKRDNMKDRRTLNTIAAKGVTPLGSQSSLQSGSFLVAHPHLEGLFSKSVICLLSYANPITSSKFENDDRKSTTATQSGTYGLIVNLPIDFGERRRTLGEVLSSDCLPKGVQVAFGDCPVRNGGPVNVSIQMLRVTTTEEEEKLSIGGQVLPMAQDDDDDDIENISTARDSDKAIYFGGDIIKAAQAVIDGDKHKSKNDALSS